MGAVAPIPWRSPAAEQALAGKAITEETVKRAILRAAGMRVA